MRIILLAMFIQSLSSCNYEKYKDTVQGNKGTYWDIAKLNSQVFETPKHSYFFGVNGTCSYFSLAIEKNGSFKRVSERVAGVSAYTWKISNDTLDLLGSYYYIRKRSANLLKLIPLDSKSDSLELKASDFQ